MAWTTPRTWVDGELVTAALMNTHVRDNLNTAWHLIARKTADETVTSSIVVQNDDHLILAVAASEVWTFQYRLRFQAIDASTGLRVALTFPAGGEVSFGAAYNNNAGTLVSIYEFATSSPSAEKNFGTPLAAENASLVIDGYYVGAGTAGNVTLQWAQVTSSGTGTVLRANSSLWGGKLA